MPACMTDSVPAIETTALSKRFGEVTAVEALDLVVEDGEAFGFLGPNGAGKSTTIDILLGLIAPTSGRATVLGHDVETESKALRRRVGVLPEGATVYQRLTGREHVESAIRMKDADDNPADRLAYVGLAQEDWDRPAGGYSKGMCRRLGLAMALVGNPDLLILDEPTSGLDPTGIQDVREIVREQADSGRAVFFSSHILPEVEAVCDRVAIMNSGRLAAVDEVDRLREATSAGARVELRVETVPDNLGLAALDGVVEVMVDDSTIRATCARPAAKMDVIRRVDDATRVLDVIAESASLEPVFNAYAEPVSKVDAKAAARSDRTAAAEESS